MSKERTRCGWAGTYPVYIRYHDREWGVPVRNDRKLFEFILLEGAQAGLSWITILKRREGYRKSFAGFDPRKVARFDRRKLDSLMKDPGIIRNRLKVESAVKNARAFLAIQKEFGSFAKYQWSFVEGGKPVRNRRTKLGQLPARTDLSDRLSKDLKKRGMSFVGTTIIYAYLQAVGVVDDHVTTCFRHRRTQG